MKESKPSALSHAPTLNRVLAGEALSPPPVWMMRQAGRYLPEYRATRSQTKSFLDLCYTPELAAEVTLQPLRRFALDAAIVFSDILVVPDALGQRVTFVEGSGPQLAPLDKGLLRADGALRRLAPVFETISTVRRRLDPGKSLIGFCGAPWTVATYMIAGHGTPDQRPARMLALESPDILQRVVDVLVEVSADYLIAQAAAGADVLMIFDSWAGVLDDSGFSRWAIEPTRRIVERVRAAARHIRLIGFPKGAGMRLGDFARGTGVDAVGVDWTMPLGAARELVGPQVALQGNLDPLRLVAGGAPLEQGVEAILAAARGGPHVFNLGHGILPETPIAHVEQMIAKVHGERSG